MIRFLVFFTPNLALQISQILFVFVYFVFCWIVQPSRLLLRAKLETIFRQTKNIIYFLFRPKVIHRVRAAVTNCMIDVRLIATSTDNFLKNILGQSRTLFRLITSFSHCNNNYSFNFNTMNWKNVDKVLGIRTQGCTMVGLNETANSLKMSHSRPLFLYFRLFYKLLIVNMFNKSCLWLDSNPGPLESKATATTVPQPLPWLLFKETRTNIKFYNFLVKSSSFIVQGYTYL